MTKARKRLYVVNTSSNQVEVYATNVSPPRQTNTIKTDATPLSLALSRETPNPRYLYVACYDGSTLDIIDLNSANFSSVSKQLDAKPQGVAVGFNGLVLISTVGTGTGAEVLITYDPVTGKTQPLSVAPPAPVAPPLPPPNGIMYLAGKSRLQASQDGKLIIGVNLQAATRTVFVFDVASSIVLGSRVVPVISPTLAVSPDGSKFLSGPMLFDTQTLAVLAQQNTANSPYVFPGNANFNVQTSQGGAVFTPDGTALLAAYNIVPTSVPAAPTNTSQMTVNTPDTMLIQLGIKLQENLGGKMAITSDGATAYAISQSGFMVLPIGTLRNQPLAMPDSTVALLASDQCGVTAALNSATIPVRDIGGGRITVTVQALAATTTTATVRATAKTYGGDVTAQFSAVAARTLGTAAADQLLIQATEAVNIIPAVRVFQNTRNAESKGTILPIDWGASTAGLADMLGDTARQRIYIANPGLNRLEVFDMQRRQFLSPIPVSQLPRSMAFGNDGNTLYVASGGGEQISVVDLTQGKVTGRVLFPPLPFNAGFGLITPALLASSQRGPQVIMSDGTLWKIVGDKVTPRPLNTNIFGTARSIPAPQTMASTPEGSFVLILAGNGTAFLYSAADDDFVAARSVIPTPIAGYYGPIAAGPNGQYYLVNDQVLNQALTPIGSSGTGPDRRRRIAHAGRSLLHRAAGRGGGGGRRVELRALQHSGDGRQRDAFGYRPGGSGRREHLAHFGYRGGARGAFGRGARRSPRERPRPEHGAGFGGHHRVRADRFRSERDSAGDFHHPEPPPGPGEWGGEYGQLPGRGGPGRLDLDFRRQPGLGRHGGEFAAAHAAGRRLRHAEQYAALAAGHFALANQCATASHAGRRTVSAGGALAHRAGGIVFHQCDGIQIRSGGVRGRAGRRALPRRRNAGESRPPREARRKADAVCHRTGRHHGRTGHRGYAVAGQSAGGDRPGFAVFWKSSDQGGGDYRGLERPAAWLHRGLPDQLPHPGSAPEGRCPAHHAENRRGQQSHHGK